MMYGRGFGGGFGMGGGGLLILLFWVLLVVGIVMLVMMLMRRGRMHGMMMNGGMHHGPMGDAPSAPTAHDEAVAIARKRLAAGEITAAQFDELMGKLKA
jgi:uncharacterized membrane protein